MKMSRCAALLILLSSLTAWNAPAQSEVYPAAILPFQERGPGVKDYGQKVSDILFAKLSTRAELMLVERAELQKVLDEQELNDGWVLACQSVPNSEHLRVCFPE